ncbi:aminotransferase-like domain-containing protein [Pseudoscardovia suis]|uniref:aminotransferase-like domain-containing protein n=1 Tax=Pseudoscardovia suis TaxID=987063 RepID=UPI003F97F58E
MAFEYDMAGRGDSSRYEYLYRCMRADIESGEAAPGQRLPSKRVLAKREGVSLVTVEKAYAQLEAEGYVQARERSGYFVALRQPVRVPAADVRTARISRRQEQDDAVPVPSGASAAPVSTAASATGASATGASAAVGEDSARPSAQPPQEFHSGSGLIADFSWPAYNPGVAATLWSKALRDTLAHEGDRELYAPQPSRGSLRLRRAIAAHLASFRGMDVDPGRIVIGAGAQMLYGMVAQLILHATGAGAGTGMPDAHAPALGARLPSSVRLPADASQPSDASLPSDTPVVAVENPGYPRLASIYSAYGFRIRHVPVDAEGIDMDGLDASGASVVHIMPSHQFPTGRVTSVTRRYELLGWLAGGAERYLVEDDYDNEFRLAGRPVPSLASIDVLGRVVYIGTFSKSLGSALRLAYMVLPPVLSRRYDDDLGFYSNTVSVVDQICLSRLLESGDYERHVNRFRTQRRTVRDLFLDALADTPAGGMCHVEEADSGLHFVLAVDAPCGEGRIVRLALRHGVRLAPMSGYVQASSAARPPADRRAARIEDMPLPGYGDSRPRFVMQYDGLTPQAAPQAARALAAAVLEANAARA